MIDVGLELSNLLRETGSRAVNVGLLRARLIERWRLTGEQSVSFIHGALRTNEIRLTDQFMLAMP